MKIIRKQANSVIVGAGTQSTNSPECRLDRGNIQFPRIVDLSMGNQQNPGLTTLALRHEMLAYIIAGRSPRPNL